MKTSIYLRITISIIVLCVIGMIWTYLPELLRDFFSDTKCLTNCYGLIEPQWIWGARHYWFWWMNFLLFLTTLCSTIMHIVRHVQKEYFIK